MKRAMSYLAVAVVVVAAIFYIKLSNREFESSVDGSFLEGEIRNIGDIALVSRKYTVPEFLFEDTSWLSTKRLVLAYQGEIKFGFNTEEIEVEVDDTNRCVDVYVPKVQIISHEVDPKNIRVLREENGWWNNIKADDAMQAVNAEKERFVKANMVDYSAMATYELREMISSLIQRYTQYQVRFLPIAARPQENLIVDAAEDKKI